MNYDECDNIACDETSAVDAGVGTISLCQDADGRSVQLSCPDDADVYQVAVLFHDFLLAVGYHPDCVDDVVPTWVVERACGFRGTSLSVLLDRAEKEIASISQENTQLQAALDMAIRDSARAKDAVVNWDASKAYDGCCGVGQDVKKEHKSSQQRWDRD